MKNAYSTHLDIKEIREAYYRHSGNFSGVTRQLAFAEGATYWTLSIYCNNPINDILILLYIFLFVFFILDTAQYFLGTKKYEKIIYQMTEKKEEEISIMKISNKSLGFCFKYKSISIVISTLLFLIGSILLLMGIECCSL